MANSIKVKRSATPSATPTTAQLALGELAINTYDGKVFIKKDNGTASVIEIGASSGTVTSVAALTLGTTGTDLSSTVANSTTTPVITLQVPTASATNRGALSSTDWSTFNNKGSGTVTSVTGTAPVASSGGTTPAISMAAATTSVNGYLTSTDWTTFNNKGSGTVTAVSVATANGVSGSSSGGATPALTIALGAITPSAVQVSGLTASQILSTDASKNLTSLAVATYPSLTELAFVKGVTSAIQTQINTKGAGTVTSVTGTSPVVSSGGATPAISMPVATTSVSGYLSSTDWTTFNNKGSGSVTSVAATVPSVLSISGSPITTSGTLAISYSGTALPVANGGTGVTTSTGSGNTVLSTSPVLTTPNLGTPSSLIGTNISGTASSLTAGIATTANGVSAGVVAGKIVYDQFTATASQTTFTTSATYISGKIEVYANGVKMVNASDVTVTNGTSVVFAVGLTVGTNVDLVYPT